MPRLDLGISQRKAVIPAPAGGWIMFPSFQERLKPPAELPPGDAKIKSWHDEYLRIHPYPVILESAPAGNQTIELNSGNV
jgi:hypothetical protein